MIATGEAKPREGEAILTPASDRDRADGGGARRAGRSSATAFRRCSRHSRHSRDLASIASGGEFARQARATAQRCPGKILALLDGIATRRDPSLASAVAEAADASPAGVEATSTVPAGAVASMRDVAAALAAVGRYFNRSEPSSPALLLVRQAEELMGKSFLEVMRVLVPNHVEQAAIQIGKDQLFRSADGAAFCLRGDRSRGGSGARTDGAIDRTDDAKRGRPVWIEAKTRADAIRLLEQIGDLLPVAEPSSPVPFLTERARSLAERDFRQPAEGHAAGRRLEGTYDRLSTGL